MGNWWGLRNTSNPRPLTLTLILSYFPSTWQILWVSLSKNQNLSPEHREWCQPLCPMLQHFQPLLHRLVTPVESKKVAGVLSGGFFSPSPFGFFFILNSPFRPFFFSRKISLRGPAPSLPQGTVMFYVLQWSEHKHHLTNLISSIPFVWHIHSFPKQNRIFFQHTSREGKH